MGIFYCDTIFDTNNPSFVWTTKVEVMPLVYMNGRDKLKVAKGEMLIKLLDYPLWLMTSRMKKQTLV